MRRRHAATLSSQLLPLFGLDPSQYRLRFDFSEVEALRENVDALHTRWRETLEAGGVDLFTFQEKIGLSPDEALKGRFVKVSAAMQEGEGGDEIKDVTRGKTTDNPHNTAGSFAHGDGGRAAGTGAGSGSGSSPILHNLTGTSGAHNPAEFWGGRNRDEVTQQLFNGKFDVEIPIHRKVAVSKQSESIFGRDLEPHEWGELIGAPDNEKLVCEPLTFGVMVQKLQDSNHPSFFKSLIRIVQRDPNHYDPRDVAFHLFDSTISRKVGGTATIAPRMIFYSAKKCHQLGLKNIISEAVGNGKEANLPRNVNNPETPIGYAYWPKLGFDAEILPKDRQQLPPRFKGAKTLLDLYEMEGGEGAWRTVGSGRKMYFNTSPDSRSQRVLAAYLEKKGIKP